MPAPVDSLRLFREHFRHNPVQFLRCRLLGSPERYLPERCPLEAQRRLEHRQLSQFIHPQVVKDCHLCRFLAKQRVTCLRLSRDNAQLCQLRQARGGERIAGILDQFLTGC